MRNLALLLFLAPAPALAQSSGLSLSGETRMGIVWERPATVPGSDRADAKLYARTRLKLKFLGETDGGVKYGAEIELDKATGRATGRRAFIGG
ncbi:MAG: porin [Rhodobacteraceae bacterium]|nr:porin [Paracoccaceae bacterium]